MKLKKNSLKKSGFIAGTGLFIIYAGLIVIAALFHNDFNLNIERTALLTGLSLKTLGGIGTTFLSVLVALACFTTAVGIVTGTADYFKGLFKNSQLVYNITAVLGCIVGVIVGSYNVEFIITLAVPALMFIYPITIVLIILNVLPQRWASPLVFKAVVLVTMLFSITDFLAVLGFADMVKPVVELVPFANHSLGWVLPAFVSFFLVSIYQLVRKTA